MLVCREPSTAEVCASRWSSQGTEVGIVRLGVPLNVFSSDASVTECETYRSFGERLGENMVHLSQKINLSRPLSRQASRLDPPDHPSEKQGDAALAGRSE